MAEKLNAKDYPVPSSISGTVSGMCCMAPNRNVGSKVKIIHEAMPEMFLDNYEEKQEQFSWSSIGSAIGGITLNAGKDILRNLSNDS